VPHAGALTRRSRLERPQKRRNTTDETETPQIVHRQDYTPPPFLVDDVELDVQFHAGEVLVNSHLQLRRNPAVPPGQPLQLDGHELETISVAIDGSRSAQTATPAATRR
jgi:aminopeptidase N